MTGILMGLCYTQCLFATAIRQRTKAAATGAVFCVMLMVLSPLLFKNIDFLEKTSFILYGLISAAFLFLIANLERIRVPMGMFTHPLVVVGGEISFSFYLFHNLLLRYMEGTLKVFREDSLAQWALGAQVTTALVVFIATVIISWLVFTCVETPGRKIIRRFLMPSKSPEAA